MNLDLYRKSFLPESGAGERVRTAEDAGVIELSADDLPAICPRASMQRWAWHPRVFLDVVNQTEAMCLYCGTRYRLRRGIHVHDHGFGARCLHQHRSQIWIPSAVRDPDPSGSRADLESRSGQGCGAADSLAMAVT